MTLYEKLDFIADSYNPLLFIAALYITVHTFSRDRHTGVIKGLLLFILIACVYVIQAFDNTFQAWHYFESDYSTHTAFSLAMVIFFFYERHIMLKAIVFTSFILYMLLILYQQYHTLIDLLSTISIAGPVMYLLAYFANAKLTSSPSER